MNLADYLSELLGQHDEVSVPGLGYFVRTRINASFNDNEARFYPPYHQVKFVPQLKEDDTFAQYVADKKNISLASSKYFVEKFISKLREDAAHGKFLFADLGSFQTEQGQLIFKPNDRIPADPAFYGYPPVQISRQGQPLTAGQRKPVVTSDQPVSPPPPQTVGMPPPATINPAPEYYEEEAEQKRGLNIWLIILIILSVVALALFGVYKFYPAAFNPLRDVYHKLTQKNAVVTPAVKPEKKPDTIKKAAALNDTIGKTATAVVKQDTAKPFRYEIIANSFKHIGWANQEVRRLKALGIVDAKVETDAPGNRLKVSVGTFKSEREADSAKAVLVNEKKIKSDSQILKLDPQK